MNVTEKVELVSRQLGVRIRTARKVKGITLEVLSEQSGLSAGFLSRVERGETNASIANLIGIAHCLGMPLRDLFEDSDTKARPDFVVSRALERANTAPMDGHGYTFHLTSGDLVDQKMSAFELEYAPGAALQRVPLEHKGEEVLYLLEGALEFEIDGTMLELNAGDCVHFNCEKPHRGRNKEKKAARLLMVVTPVNSLT